MTDVFISYKRGPDEARVEGLVGALRANGYSVWWDRDIAPGAPWEATIQAALHDAKAVIVCWSPTSVASENVRAEARWAKDRGKLLQIYIEACAPPLFFGEQQGVMLLDPADLYGSKFAEVRAALDAFMPGAASGGAESADAAVRAWTRQEPAARWEAGQYGVTLGLVSLLLGLIAAALTHATERLPIGLRDTVLLYAALCIALPLVSALAGWAWYRLLGSRPRRLGLIRGGLLALAVGLSAALLTYPLLIALLWATTFLPEVSPGVGGWATGAGFAGPIALVTPFLWTPIWLFVARSTLRVRLARIAAILVLVVTPLAVSAFSVLDAVRREGLAEVQQRIDVSIRAHGLAKPEDLQWQPFSAETLARVQQDLGLEPTGEPSDAMLRALLERNEKHDWVVAADGSRDATSIHQAVQLSAGDIDIDILPGVYRIENIGGLSGAFGGSEASALDENVNAQRIVTVRGAGRRSEIVLEVRGGFSMPPGSVLENVTIRAPAEMLGAVVTLQGPTILRNVAIEGGQDLGVAVAPPPSDGPHARASELPMNFSNGLGIASTSLTGARIASVSMTSPLRTAILVRPMGRAEIEDVTFPQAERCVDIESERLVAVTRSDLSNCPARGAIRAINSARLTLADNTGPSDVETTRN